MPNVTVEYCKAETDKIYKLISGRVRWPVFVFVATIGAAVVGFTFVRANEASIQTQLMQRDLDYIKASLERIESKVNGD